MEEPEPLRDSQLDLTRPYESGICSPAQTFQSPTQLTPSNPSARPQVSDAREETSKTKANPRLIMGSKEELFMTAGSGSESSTQLQKQYNQRRTHLEHVAAIAERTGSVTQPMS